MVICADDPELLDKLDQAAEKGELWDFMTFSVFGFTLNSIQPFCSAGLRVMVTHVEHVIPSPQFLARLAPPAGRCLPGLKQHGQQTHHPEFRLFLSTHLPVRLLDGGKNGAQTQTEPTTNGP